ncbi:MAG: DMT family transporter [Micromonosporaceae bacterium]|nr:DMT family transporter [Micromonosporaceae bacterium]
MAYTRGFLAARALLARKPRPAPSARRGIGYIALAAASWGTTGAAAAILYRRTGLDPVAVSFWRFGAAVAVLAAARPLRLARLRRALAGRWRYILVTGAGLAVYHTAYFAAVQLAGVTVATVVTLGAGPVLIALGGRVALGERLGRTGTVATVAALLGVGLLVAGGGGGAGEAPLLGCGLGLLSALGYAGVTLLTRATGRAGDPYDTVLASFAVGTAALLPAAIVGGMLPYHGDALLAAGLIGYLGAVPTALAYGLFFAGLRVVPAATAAVVALLEAVTAAVLGVAALGERPTLPSAAGAVLLLVSVVCLSAAQ